MRATGVRVRDWHSAKIPWMDLTGKVSIGGRQLGELARPLEGP